MDRRKPKTYRGCTITPQIGDERYFGHPNWKHARAQYKRFWWKIVFPDQTWCLAGYIQTAKECIDRCIHRHVVN